MQFTETITVVLVAVGVVFLFMLLLAVVRAGACLQRVERLLAERDLADPEEGGAPLMSKSAKAGAFREFLSEDPERWNLPKREQFDAYRVWRREKGLNWPKP